MKKLFTLSLILSIAVACNPSPQEKAEALVKEAVLKSLYIPDSYEAVETIIDSAFSPYHDPVFITNILDYHKKCIEQEELETKMKKAKYIMTLSSGPYMTSYIRMRYNEAKEDYEKAKVEYDALNAKTQKMAEGISKQILKKPEFIGYRVHHRYRAKNNAGDVLIGDAHFLLDNDLTQIIAQYDEEELNTFNSFFQQIAEVAENNQ